MQVTNDFQNIYLHDSIIDGNTIEPNRIILKLRFAHILREHKDNNSNRIICAQDCNLIFSNVKQSILNKFNDDTKLWDIVENPNHDELMHDFESSEMTAANEYKLSGMSNLPQWVEWTIKCKEVSLEWIEETDSWLTEK
jgi:hypothetical protein